MCNTTTALFVFILQENVVPEVLWVLQESLVGVVLLVREAREEDRAREDQLVKQEYQVSFRQQNITECENTTLL